MTNQEYKELCQASIDNLIKLSGAIGGHCDFMVRYLPLMAKSQALLDSDPECKAIDDSFKKPSQEANEKLSRNLFRFQSIMQTGIDPFPPEKDK